MPACHPCRTLTLLRCLVLGGCLLLVGGADECGSSNVCTAAGQICNDPDPAVPNNWVCSCAGSGSGTQVGAKATCTYTGTDCAMNMIFCRQTACDDPDGTMDGNWRCACPPPQRTVKYGDVMTSAECEMDECLFAANAGVCSAVGQSCNDPDKSTTRVGDWTCNCATGTGSATAAAATCTATGECVANEATCAAAKQACEDPSTMATGDWQCVCVAPTTGAPRVGGVATCTLDECAVACPTCAYDGTTDACAAKGQQCKDPDTSVGSTGDWACFLDECLTMSTMCTGTQVCSDPNTAPTSTNDWTCSCVLPQTGSATAGAATCVQDECTEAAKGTVCSNAGQQCEDPNTATASLGDYTCKCVLPSTGTPGTATPATCMGQGGCATSASTCTDVGQFCTPATMGFKCICLSPSTGTPGDSAPAACTLDECTTVCPTCADTGSGSQCGAAACTDPNTSAQSTGDWSCALDECTKNGATCTAASQTCSDPKPASNSLADWECQCTAPATGSAVAGVATCSEDECIVSAATCPMGQTCNDPDKTKAGDWTCNCDAPTTGSSTASAATCEEDECVASGNTCTTAAQECKDPNKATTSKGDWTCNCIAPATGVPVTVAAATCTQVGECVANAKTCTDASQTCDDPDMAVMGDWQCKCIAPATGFAVAGVATCTVDECVANAATCPMGQTCNDPDKTKAGDWTCNCDAPTTGSSIASAATCEEDECVANGNTCTTAAQECKDPNKATTSKGDWACNCIAPATGVPVKAAAATCTQVGECVANAKTCTDASQTCEDPDMAVMGDWQCKCIAPATGFAVAGVATCTVDECVANAATCPMGQTCNDPDKTKAGDWTCNCDAPTTGSSIASAATCEEDECVANGNTCTTAAQECKDPNKATTSKGDWTCNCIAPATGAPVTAAAATCTQVGECVANAKTCTDASQTCEDPDMAVMGDWQCKCIAPATGFAVAGVATCTVDECVANAATCPMGQTCNDPDKTKAGDWTCNCDAPTTGSSIASAATCEEDECVANGNTCTTAAQECKDPNKATTSKGDWTCNCIAPATGAPVTAAAATCTQVGECVANAKTCTDAAQTCEDPDMAVMGDWQCKCIAPATGFAVAGVATCTVDECVANAATCPMAQTCNDPDKTKAGDWTCNCDAPTTGSSIASAATCEEDECVANGNTCTTAAQECKDPNKATTSKGDWTCNCIAPATGVPVTAAAATCTQVGECVANAKTCTDASQTCEDPDMAVMGDWQCKCIAPATGFAVAGVATCTVDECVANAVTCPMGQTCNDPDKTKAGDWTCNCDAPTTGSSTASAATCEEDECVANGNTCTTAAQECKDPNKATTSKGDWTCNCIAPATGAPVTAAAATCTQVGECVANAKTCTDASQTCEDPDMAVMGDWQCKCIAPATGFAVAGVATCTVDECVANAATCPMGQTCNDPDKTKAGDWTCNCDAPTTGSSIASAATCEEDECVANGNTCTTAAQECKDPNKATTSKGDWTCNCIAPATGAPVTAAAATCTQVGECVANAKTCTDASQTCEDPDMAVMGDWQCKCIAPATGFAVAGVATCTVDECVANAATCPMGQTCNDPDKTKAGDWTCNCDAPTTGSSIASAATCEEDECVANGNTCTTAAQECKDPNKATTSKGDWTCNCIAPATGAPVTAAAATCTQVGECVANAKTCTDAAQTCEDPDMAVMGDWQCKCIAPATGFAVAGVATCTVDECVANAATCPMGQTCNDPDKTKAGDWTCNCDAPTTGSSIASAATCEEDECVANANTCTTAAQECKDPNKATTSKGDWTCNCIAPATGAPVTAAAATCTQVGECLANAKTCTDASQTCEDPDMAVMGDWQCKCIAPATGFAVAGVATCTVDECVANAATCPMGQTCNDPDKTKTGDWTCNCDAPTTGSSIASAATCEEDECDANGNTCTTAAQECKDPNKATTSKGDWTCNCIAPATGVPVKAAAATCTQVGECVANAKTCTDASQTCEDPDMAVMGDWQCKCIAPATGFAVAGVATCTVDECVANAATCPMGQTCNDPDKTKAGDWTCNCDAPTTGSSTASAATCEEDECVANGNTCTTAAQECKDPNKATTSKGDWTCNCIAPATGAPVTAAAATCTQVGECVANAKTCTDASQTCEDPDMAVMGDWQCKCIAPATGFAVAGVATCTVDECVANAATCPMGQTCNDPDKTKTGDWTCNCDAPTTGSSTASAATCEEDECVANGNTCTTAAQECKDPNKATTSKGDWTCNCIAPATGAPVTAAAATCTQVGECVANAKTCTDASQTCEDPDMAVMGDWQCKCIAPATGFAVAGVATCTMDECGANAATCPMGQTCNDPDKTKAGDWTCNCDAPTTGSSIASAATCEEDECVANGNTCTTAAQECKDPNKATTSKGDWTCNCIAPATGAPVTAAAATCTQVGECLANAKTCTDASQSCDDPDMAVMGDWQCKCIAPATGFAVAGVATCTVDECVTNAATCPMGQTCSDPDNTKAGDWTCNCDAPTTGSSTASAATCEEDECVANGNTCTTAAQECKDPNKATTSKGDWTCNCIAPATGVPVKGAVATCAQVGECVANAKTCTDASQSCDDPDVAVMGDWQCKCIAPATGFAVAGVAKCTEDECVANAGTCTVVGQTCNDPDQTSAGDWLCVCPAPSVATGTAAPAPSCDVDECVDNAGVCAAAGQSCDDPNKSPSSLMDWTCNCMLPATGKLAIGAPTACTDTGSCVANSPVCKAANQSCSASMNGSWTCNCIAPAVGTGVESIAVCTSDECAASLALCPAGQDCVDPDPAVSGDWQCRCRSPHSGTATGGSANCTFDECAATGNAVCNAKGQMCEDPNPDPAVTGDWVCNCIPPATGTPGTAAPGNCTAVGECAVHLGECTAAGQTCNDPDVNTTDDWECVCIAPQTGTKKGGPAPCIVDECITNAATCTAAMQNCVDSNTSPNSTDDWVCNCVPPLVGSSPMAAVVSCSQSGECEGNNKMVCEAAGQVCFDPDAAVLGDWRCRCVSPTNGSAEGKAAACDLDECVQNRDTCSAQGQACVDSNMDAMSLNDWECRCVSPAAGMPGTASAAACVQVGECQTQGNLDICIAQNQSCNDPDPMVAGDWQCECISPQVGDPGKQAAAACGISECYDNEATCAAAGQACVDPDPTKQGDWKCSCIPPQVGSAATGPASCGTDECGSQGAVCTSKGQTCSDPDYSIANDFTCTCAGSGTGTGVGANASCSWVGECTTKYTICEGFGQACFDPDTNVKDDWECHCVAPQPNGTAVGKQAACGAPPPLGLLVDECDQNKDVCNSQGQECSDPDTNATSLGDWKCLCQHSGVGVQVAGAATCVHSDGCGMNSSDVCVLAGQACKSSSSSTFSCMCVGGKTGSQPGGAAVCSAAAPLTPGAGCSWDEETKCNDDHKCEWLVDKLSCAPRYCEQRTEKCELDPICERVVGTKECVRSRCGLFTTPDDCLAADNCVWMENLGGHMPLTGVPYPLSPAYCTHEGDPNDNSDLLHWLIIIAVILCLCATAAMYLATKLRARLQRKEEHREREEEMQRELLKPERELAELWRVQSHGAELGAELRKPVPDAPALARVRNADGNGQDQQNQADSEEEQEPEGNETERAQMLREQLERLKLKQAEQAIQSQQRGEAQGLERRKRQLELEMDKEENRKETQRQLDRAQASHALQFGVAQRKAARRQRERQREQELLLDVEKTQSLINQQRRRRDDLGSKTHELNELTADGKPVHTDGDLTDGELERQAQADSALETLLHGGGSAGGGGDSVAAAAPAPVVGNVLSPPSRGVARHRYPAQAVTLQTIHSEAPEDAAGSTTSSKDDDPKLMESVQKSHQPSEWDMRSNFKAGVGERKAAPVTDYKSHYDKLVSEIVEDKLSAGETRRSMDPELGASTSSPRPAGAAAAIPEAAMGPEWDALLTSVVKNSDAAGSYDAAHSSAPVLPRSPGDARRVTV